MQISSQLVRGINRIQRQKHRREFFTLDDRYNQEKSRRMFEIFQEEYNPYNPDTQRTAWAHFTLKSWRYGLGGMRGHPNNDTYTRSALAHTGFRRNITSAPSTQNRVRAHRNMNAELTSRHRGFSIHTPGATSSFAIRTARSEDLKADVGDMLMPLYMKVGAVS